jgi:hypothetical protein
LPRRTTTLEIAQPLPRLVGALGMLIVVILILPL